MPVPYSPVGVGPEGKKGLTAFLGLNADSSARLAFIGHNNDVNILFFIHLSLYVGLDGIGYRYLFDSRHSSVFVIVITKKSKIKSCTFSWLTLCPYFSTMFFYKFFAKYKAKSGSFFIVCTLS